MNKRYSIEVIEENDGFHLVRKSEGFSPLELIGLCEMAQLEILQQMSGDIKPDKITRQVVTEKDNTRVEAEKRLENGRQYLMSVQTKEVKVEEAFEAFGYDAHGFQKHL